MVASPMVNTGNNIMGGPKNKNLVLSKNSDLNGASYERFGRNHNAATIGGPATTSAIQAQAN